MEYNFDSRCPSWDKAMDIHTKHGLTDYSITPHCVAEMRFDIAPEIKQALQSAVESGNFGYSWDASACNGHIAAWMKERHDWSVEPSMITHSYGVVAALGACVREYSKPGDGIIIQTPVYPPFYSAISGNGRSILENPLVESEGAYSIDFKDFEAKAKLAKMFILCNPHNPVGRVFSREELSRLADICVKNSLIVISDEIHSDLIMPGFKHVPLPLISEEIKRLSIVCTAPSKTFNLAGLATSSVIIESEELRERFCGRNVLENGHFINNLGLTACAAAYAQGRDWLEQLIAYIDGNRKLSEKFFNKNMPEVGVTPLEGSYLQWLDFSALAPEPELFHKFLEKEASFFISPGGNYGKGYEAFARLNLASPKSAIEASLARLWQASKEKGLI